MGLEGLASFQGFAEGILVGLGKGGEILCLGKVGVLIGDGERACLVDDEGVHLAQVFEGSGVLDEDLLLRRLSYSHHQGSGSRQAHGAGTGDHQYGNGAQYRLWQTGIATHQPPYYKGKEGDACHCGYEDQCRLIDDALHGGLASLRLLHHTDNLRQGGLLAYLLGTHAELALARDGSCQHLVAHPLGGRSWLARYHRLIHIGGIGGHKALGLCHRAIHGNLLSGTHLDDVAIGDGGDGHFLHLVIVRAFQFLVGHQSGCLRLQAHQLADAACRTVLRLLLQASAGEDEGDDHHRGIEVSVPLDAPCSPHLFAEEGIEGTEEEGDEGAECHERIHVGGMMLELLPRRNIKLATAIQHIRQSQEQTNLVGERTVHAVRLHANGDPSHGESHGEDGEEPRQEGLALQ